MEYDEYMKRQHRFKVKVNIRIDQHITDNVIIISLTSANNNENQAINVVDEKKESRISFK